MTQPTVSVVMPVYNAEKYLRQAIESILNQTFKDFEFLIFNDGSTDESANIVEFYTRRDTRIIFFNYQQNTGYLKHLNQGIIEAKGKYIARMDADDISFPERFEKQVTFMEDNQEIGVCGTWFSIFSDSTTINEKVKRHPMTDIEIKIALLRYCCFGHPTIMAKTQLLKLNPYNKDFYPAEDFDLWARLVPITKFHNIPEVLLAYRWHGDNISVTQRKAQESNTKKVQLFQLERLGILKNETSNLLMLLFGGDRFFRENQNQVNIKTLAKNIKQILLTNKKVGLYDKILLENFIKHSWIKLVRFSLNKKKMITLFTFLLFPFPKFLTSTIQNQLKRVTKISKKNTIDE